MTKFMEMHTVNSYDNELNKLRYSIINMANLVKELVFIANQAVQNTAQSYRELANNTDLKINHYDEEAEHLAVHVLALRQPLAIDLRQVIAALKLAVILERMGDLAKKVSHRIEFLPIKLDPAITDLVEQMSKELSRLLTDVVISYEQLDDNLAMKVREQDKLIDEKYRKIMNLVQNEISTKPEYAQSWVHLVLVARNFERIGDYISKIACITHYIITGERLEK